MAKRVKAQVKPELLSWARRTARLSVDEAASRLRVKVEKLQAWEDGKERCSIPQLRKLSALYKRPLAVFYLPEPPRDFVALRDFRRIPTQVEYEESPELAAEIRWAHQIREVAVETFTLADFEVPDFTFRVKPDDDPSVIADTIREELGLGIAEQFSWQHHYQALDGWRKAIEGLGVICLQISGVSVREARGFSIFAERLPVIAVNARDVPTARIFSMVHELAHLMLGESGKCDLHEDQRSMSETDRIEVFCNRIAGATLVPSDTLLSTATVQSHDTGEHWNASELSDLVGKFNVSEEVVVRRLLTLGLTTFEFYKTKREEYLRRVERRRKASGGNYYGNMKNRLGTSLIMGVMSALQQRRITANDASAFLGVKVPNLSKLFSTAIG
jgi:Zn-dependent peptidase ImmA (M78 family)